MMLERWPELLRQFEIRNLLLKLQADVAARPRWKFRGTYDRKRTARRNQMTEPLKSDPADPDPTTPPVGSPPPEERGIERESLKFACGLTVDGPDRDGDYEFSLECEENNGHYRYITQAEADKLIALLSRSRSGRRPEPEDPS